MATDKEDLQRSAGQGLIWGVGFNLARDVIQFASMLILVRLLSPQIYGQFALAQTIQIFLACASYKAIAPFALQARDPTQFDWDTHFSAGVTLNSIVTIVTLILAGGFYFFGGENLKAVGFVLTLMALVFPIEVISTHYFLWLQARHLWKRMRLLLLVGALVAALISVMLAVMGAGIVVLAVGNMIFVLPLIVDYFVRRPYPLRFLPNWYRNYREGLAFGANRIASTSLQTGANVVEHSILSGIFGFSTLGVYTRSIGLAQITSGRIGPVVIQTLYPVLTRAEASTERFRRFAGLLFQGVVWTSLPAAVFLGLEADRLVRLLYGEKWVEVIPLMAAAAALLALRGLHLTMNQLMLANLQQRLCLRLDLTAGLSQVAVIAFTFFGPGVYLWALAGHAALILTLTIFFGVRTGTIEFLAVARDTLACFLAVSAAGAALIALSGSHTETMTVISLIVQISFHALCFGAVYVIAIRLLAPERFANLIKALPLPAAVERAINRVLCISWKSI